MRRLLGLLLALIVTGSIVVACGGASDDDGAPTVGVSPTAAGVDATPSTEASQPTPTAAASASITISAVGDISLAREVVPRMEANGPGYPYQLIEHLLSGDVVVGNLEGALTDRGEPWPKGYNFRTPPRFASGLLDAGFDIVSLANNHTMDYGGAGLTDTLDALDAAGVRRIGAGRTLGDAQTPVIAEANGLSVALIGCADTPTEGGGFAIRDWAAGESAPGLFICDDAALIDAIASARQQADFVVAVVHAGSEYITAPDATQRRIADTVLAAGADAYIGHHAHVVQPIEQRGAQLIAWGLGNFIFDLDDVDLANIPVPRVSLILNVTLTQGQGVTAFEAVPVVLDAGEDRPRPATPEEAAVLQSLIAP
jgi:poly-gamma-glutamate synthesis protein (capsule biosynthesis protein)